MIIYMHDHKSTPAGDFGGHAYGEEIMNSNWNPAVVHLADYTPQQSVRSELPEDYSTADVDEFLDRVYALATQI